MAVVSRRRLASAEPHLLPGGKTGNKSGALRISVAPQQALRQTGKPPTASPAGVSRRRAMGVVTQLKPQAAALPKDLYEVGEIPPLGHVPARMYAWAIRRERHGEPESAMQVEIVATPSIAPDEVLVMVMAAGVNYNGVWAAL